MYCKNCGEQIDDHAAYCPHCGAFQGNEPVHEEKASLLLCILCFLIPIVGLILFIVYKDDQPQKSHDCGKMALIAILLDVALKACAVLVSM